MNALRNVRRCGLAVVTLTLATVVLTGCLYPNPPATKADPVARENYPRNIALQNLDYGMVGGAPSVEPSTADKPMRVSVPMRNITDYGINVQYMFEFFDTQGRVVPRAGSSVQNWRFVHMDPSVMMYFDGAALDTTAVDWRLTVRSAR